MSNREKYSQIIAGIELYNGEKSQAARILSFIGYQEKIREIISFVQDRQQEANEQGIVNPTLVSQYVLEAARSYAGGIFYLENNILKVNIWGNVNESVVTVARELEGISATDGAANQQRLTDLGWFGALSIIYAGSVPLEQETIFRHVVPSIISYIGQRSKIGQIIGSSVSSVSFDDMPIIGNGVTNTMRTIFVPFDSSLTFQGEQEKEVSQEKDSYVVDIASTESILISARGTNANPIPFFTFKEPVSLLSDSNIAVLSGLQTIDGIATTEGMRVLLVAQTNAVNNGIWEASSGTWNRPTDFKDGMDVSSAFVLVQQGLTYADTAWVCTDNYSTAIVGTNNLTFIQFGIAPPVTTSIIQVGIGTGSSERIGSFNSASGTYSTAFGKCNTASGNCSIVSGGYCNTASCNYSTVSGGYTNTASGYYSTIGGGSSNTASFINSTIVGGFNNVSSDHNSFVGGGSFNTASAPVSSVAGGFRNIASNHASTIGGGHCNTASGNISTVGGGRENTSSSDYSTVGGGYCNTASNNSSTIGGGYCNTASGYKSTVSGGYSNSASYGSSTVGGGYSNSASSSFSTVSGGIANYASSGCSTVSGGRMNIASGYSSTISGGYSNTALGGYTSVSGGYGNESSNYSSVVSGGKFNKASGAYSGVLGGLSNIVSNTKSYIVGSNITSDRDCTTFVNQLSAKNLLISAVDPNVTGLLWYDSVNLKLRISNCT